MKNKLKKLLVVLMALVMIIPAASVAVPTTAYAASAPSTPWSVWLTSAGSNQITVHWNAVSGATNYLVFRQQSAIANGVNGWVQIATTGNTTSYTDYTAKDGVVYSYTVIAKNSAGNSGYLSQGATGITAYRYPIFYNVRISNKSKAGFRVTGNIQSSGGVSSVLVSVYSTKNGADDKTQQYVPVSNGAFSFDVYTSQHQNDYGEYYIDFQATDYAGHKVNNESYSALAYVPDGKAHLSNPYVQSVTSDAINLAMTFDAPNGLQSATVYAYSAAEGSSNGKTINATVDQDVLRASIKLSDHANYQGKYTIVYTLTDKSGNKDSYTFNVNSTDAKYAQMQMTSIDVRAGDSTLLESNGQFFLVDCGMQEDSVDEVIRVLREHQVSNLTVLITHPHCDHLEGLKMISDAVKINKVYINQSLRSDYYTDYAIYEYVMTYVQNKGIPIENTPAVGSTISVGNITCEIVGPTTFNPVGVDGATNCNSTWLKVNMGGKIALISGDAESATEKAVIASGKNLKADIVQVNHHGLPTSSSQEYINATKPTYAIFSGSLGYDANYCVTTPRFQDAGTTVLKTNQLHSIGMRVVNGTITPYSYNSMPTPASDTTMPTAVRVTNLSSAGYTITLNVNAPRGLSKVQVPTWTKNNGQDDIIWYNPSWNNSTITLNVKTSNHKGETGIYTHHFYMTDGAGRQTVFVYDVTVPKPVTYAAPTISSASVSNVTSGGYQVNVSFQAPAGVREVLMPTWTDKNGQDDIIWHKATVSGNTASFYVKASDHKNESGKYITHIYVYDKQGRYAIVGKETNVPAPASTAAPSISKVTVSNVSSSGYTVTATFSAPAGLREVLMPTWTNKNGQDDIVWHKASVSGNTATFKVTTAAHKGESGSYITHVYVYDVRGREACYGVTANVPAASSSASTSTSYVYGSVNYALVFDPTYYANRYPDLKNVFGYNANSLLQHFVTYGINEGRQAKATFNVVNYKNRYPDLQRAFGNNMRAYVDHYLNYGYKEGRNAQ